ncbi:MAG: hypothetical protein QOE36_961, partial [Gaiellaceae bacterium]|nr:hypothetical protein [Gaiellaceae bacterium]
PFLTGGGGYHLLAVQANSAGHWSATLPAYLNKTNVTTVANDGAQNSSEFGQ